MSLKDWKKIRDDDILGRTITYVKKNKSGFVSINKSGKKWVVILPDEKFVSFKTKVQAVKFALNYRRTH